MKDDPTIAAVREARHRISQSIDHDPRKLIEHYKQRHRKRLVSDKPRHDAAETSVCDHANTRMTT